MSEKSPSTVGEHVAQGVITACEWAQKPLELIGQTGYACSQLYWHLFLPKDDNHYRWLPKIPQRRKSR